MDVYAETTSEAQRKAAVTFKAKKHWDVSVMLCEKGTDGTTPGEQVMHIPSK